MNSSLQMWDLMCIW